MSEDPPKDGHHHHLTPASTQPAVQVIYNTPFSITCLHFAGPLHFLGGLSFIGRLHFLACLYFLLGRLHFRGCLLFEVIFLIYPLIRATFF